MVIIIGQQYDWFHAWWSYDYDFELLHRHWFLILTNIILISNYYWCDLMATVFTFLIATVFTFILSFRHTSIHTSIHPSNHEHHSFSTKTLIYQIIIIAIYFSRDVLNTQIESKVSASHLLLFANMITMMSSTQE